MKALTLWRPWSHAVAHLHKRCENREWSLPRSALGQRFAVHAGKTLDRHAVQALVAEGFSLPETFPEGIVATATFVGIAYGDASTYDVKAIANCSTRRRLDALIANDAGLWFSGPYGWLLDDVIPLPRPIAARGAQGLWTLPHDIARQVPTQRSAHGRVVERRASGRGGSPLLARLSADRRHPTSGHDDAIRGVDARRWIGGRTRRRKDRWRPFVSRGGSSWMSGNRFTR